MAQKPSGPQTPNNYYLALDRESVPSHGLDSDMSQSHSDDVEFILCICIPFPLYI